MQNKTLSIIIPLINDENNLSTFCKSVFSAEPVVELIILSKLHDETIESISEYADKIKVFSGEDKSMAIQSAVNDCVGDYLIFLNTSVTIAANTFETMIDFADDHGCVCNVGMCCENNSGKLFRENFLFDEVSEKPVYCNYILNKSVINEHKLVPISESALALVSFFAEYSLYDDIKPLHSVLMYLDSKPQKSVSKEDINYIVKYAEYFAECCNDKASMHYVRNIIATFGIPETKEAFVLIKKVLTPFKFNYGINAWLISTFGIDMDLICKEESDFEEFNTYGKRVMYKEITMPLLADNVVREFFAGKLGADTLKRCVGAWSYYKLYRGKTGIVKKIGCKICKRMLGGEFVE